jgi:hypothetical protein
MKWVNEVPSSQIMRPIGGLESYNMSLFSNQKMYKTNWQKDRSWLKK